MTKLVIKGINNDDAKIFIDDVELSFVRKISLEMTAGITPKATIELFNSEGIDMQLPDQI